MFRRAARGLLYSAAHSENEGPLSIELLKSVADACPLALIVHRMDDRDDDRTFRIIHANRNTESQLAVKPGDIIGRLCEEVFTGLRERGYIERLTRVVRTGVPEDYEDFYYADERIVAVFAGHIERVAEDTTATWFENITRRKQLEIEAARAVTAEQESEERSRALAELTVAKRAAEDALDTYKLSAAAADEALWSIDLAEPGSGIEPATPCRFSDRFAEMVGLDPTAIEHTFDTFRRFAHPDDASRLDADFHALFDDPNQRMVTAHRLVGSSGQIRHVQTSARAATDARGRVRKIAGAIRDMTAEKLAELEQLDRLAEIERQQSLIEVLSTPILELWEDVIALPIMGALDRNRTENTMRVLLEEVRDKRVRFALLDLTGVDAIDTTTAEHVVRIAQAVAMLGARAIVTGIQPAVAQTLVDLGIDLSAVSTRRNLRDGLRDCLQSQSREASRRSRP